MHTTNPPAFGNLVDLWQLLEVIAVQIAMHCTRLCQRNRNATVFDLVFKINWASQQTSYTAFDIVFGHERHI